MNILFLSQRFLLPMDAGGKIRTGKILEQLAHTDTITMISNVESPRDDPYLPEISRFCHRFVPVPWQEIKKHSFAFLTRLMPQMCSRYPVSVLNSSSRSLRQAVEHEAAQTTYDVAICDFVQSALEFKNISGVPRILFQHNVESVIARRHWEQARNPIERFFWWLQWRKMFSFEAAMCRTFDAVIAVSEQDRQTFQTLYQVEHVMTIPTGVDVEYFAPDPAIPEEDWHVSFCGSLDWLPNEDAVLFFIRAILPLVKAKIPAIRFTVVGKNPSPALHKLVQDVPEITLTGWVSDTRPYLARSAACLVPLRIGGGTRMKIYEAMAMDKPVVSTTIGAEGLPVTHGEHIVIADQPGDFAEQLIALLQDRAQRRRIGTASGQFVRQHFAWQGVAQKFRAICQTTQTRQA